MALSNIAEIISRGSAENAAASGMIGKTLMGIGSDMEQSRNQERELAQRDEMVKMQKEQHAVSMQESQYRMQEHADNFTKSLLSSLGDQMDAVTSLTEEESKLTASMSALERAASLPVTEDKGTPFTDGEASPAVVDMESLQNKGSEIQSSLTQLVGKKKAVQETLNANILKIVENPLAVAALLKSNFSNTVIGERLKQGFQTDDPVQKEKFITAMQNAATAYRTQEQLKADRELRTGLMKKTLEANVTANAQMQKEIAVAKIKGAYDIAVARIKKEDKEGAGESVINADTTFVEVMDAVSAGGPDKDNPEIVISNPEVATKLTALKDAASKMKPADSRKDKLLFDEFLAAQHARKGGFDAQAMIGDLNRKDVKGRFSPNSPYESFLRIYATTIPDTESSRGGFLWLNKKEAQKGNKILSKRYTKTPAIPEKPVKQSVTIKDTIHNVIPASN